MCEKEFDRNPEHYLEVMRVVFGEDAADGHSSGTTARRRVDRAPANIDLDKVHMMDNLNEGFAEIARAYEELYRHFDQISTTGGLEGLRMALLEHRGLMDDVRKKMNVHAGACRFVTSVTASYAMEPCLPSEGYNR